MKRTEKIALWKRVVYFFPIQLLLIQLQRNFLLLFFWAIITAFLHGWVGNSLGIRYLFLAPEYLGKISFTSFFIIGIALGGFIAAFQISSYILNSRAFPFLATLSRPFFKYSLNNSLIPFAFVASYIVGIIRFQYKAELLTGINPYYFAGALVLGILVFNFLMYTYFFALSRDLKKLFGRKVLRKSRARSTVGRGKKRKLKPGRKFWRIFDSTYSQRAEEWPVETYLNNPISIRYARSGMHYPYEMLDEVFRKNHFNSAVFQILTMISLLIFGIFREEPAFQIPAAAAILLASTVLLMLAGFFRFAFGRWAIFVVILLFGIINFLVSERVLVYTNYVYGLDYKREPVFYNTDSIADHIFSMKNVMDEDKIHHENILNNWKKKVSQGKNKYKKPKLIITVASGGGSKAAYWTMTSLQHADSLLQGELLNHTYMMTGSSGGMIGSTYLRELMWKKQNEMLGSYYGDSLRRNVGKDLLNFVALTLSLNDLFIRNGKFEYAGHEYPKDRGYAFEKLLNENTGYLLDKPLVSHKSAEYKAQIPLIVFAPTIINDGRRLLISAQPMSFLSHKTPIKEFNYHPKIEDIEFSRLFENHGAENLTLTTAIRMNATFPFILPPVSLPTIPVVEVMDAGIRDNYGFHTALKYIFTFRKWIEENTDGVILLEISDGLRSDYERAKDRRPIRNLVEGFIAPLGGILGNVTSIQVYHNQQYFYYVAEALGGKLQHVVFDLTDYSSKEISMSLHLTEAEKRKIAKSMDLPWNRNAVKELAEALKVELKE
ncbi:MAG: patatin-like phospholipase family protein [Flavobacteriales bacterium]|nr:patatin-like phospholipase family protein [Flavobacteriales bacterium]